jgi:hypothetical protein
MTEAKISLQFHNTNLITMVFPQENQPDAFYMTSVLYQKESDVFSASRLTDMISPKGASLGGAFVLTEMGIPPGTSGTYSNDMIPAAYVDVQQKLLDFNVEENFKIPGLNSDGRLMTSRHKSCRWNNDSRSSSAQPRRVKHDGCRTDASLPKGRKIAASHYLESIIESDRATPGQKLEIV